MSDAYTDIAKETERALEIVRKNNPGPSLNETKDPVKRMRKLNERREHLENIIEQIRDQLYLIESEIIECRREIVNGMDIF